MKNKQNNQNTSDVKDRDMSAGKNQGTKKSPADERDQKDMKQGSTNK